MNTVALKKGSDTTSLLFLLALFIIWPFAAFLLALTQAAKRSSYVIYALFGMLFAWHMDSTGADRFDDIVLILQRVQNSDYSYQEVMEQLYYLITFSDKAPKEWYEIFMIWLSKSFTSNPHFYFVLCSIPWLFFELSSLNTITSDSKFRQGWICIIILALFVLPRDIITLQNPRFTTATWAAIYGTIKYFECWKHRWKYIIFILITPIIHSAFFFYIGAFIVGNIMFRFPRLSLYLLYISIPFSYLSYDILSTVNFSSLPIPSTLSNWIDRYMSAAAFSTFVMNEGASGYYWIGSIFGFVMKTAYLMVPIYLIKYRNSISKDTRLWRFCGYFLFFYALVSFIQFIPVLGERFYWLVRIFAIYIWFKAVYPKHNWVIMLILIGCFWGIFRRYFYHGAVESSVPLGIFYEPLPLAILDNMM